jgi:hypothetical protein
LQLILVLCLVTGCGGGARQPKDYLSEPSGITLESAMEQVTDGLQKMVGKRMDAEKRGTYEQLGLHAAEVIITFNVTGSATKEDKLFVDMTMIQPPSPAAAGRAGFESVAGETASRGNQITVRFVNLLFATDDTLVSRMDGHQLHRLRHAIAGKDPGPLMLPVAPGEDAQAGAAPAPAPVAPSPLPDLPAISPAASDQGSEQTPASESPVFGEILRQKAQAATRPTTRPR